MQRCPCCNARLSAASLCPRCGAELDRAMRCESLAKLWLSVSLQMLDADQADIAVAAVQRSLSFKQTQEARVFRDFLVQHQYQALYRHLEHNQWQEARQTLTRLRVLQGESEALRRFLELIEHLELASQVSTIPTDNIA